MALSFSDDEGDMVSYGSSTSSSLAAIVMGCEANFVSNEFISIMHARVDYFFR